CAPYSYPIVANAISSFPVVWSPATILENDTNALTKWQAIQKNVPDIPTKGTPTGDITGVNYTASDPDCWWTYSKCTKPKWAGIPEDIDTVPEPRTLGYGFDDGPNCSHNAFYDYLKEHNQKATMFYIGSNVMNWPLEAKRGYDDGHEICILTEISLAVTALPSENVFAELYYSGSLLMEAVKLVTGVTPTCWRPPYGDVDDRVRAISFGLGLQNVLWNYDSNDWQVGELSGVTAATVDGLYQKLIDDAGKGMFETTGAMILAHELNNFTMSKAVEWHSKLAGAFKYIVTVATATNNTTPYVETNVTMPTFAQRTCHPLTEFPPLMIEDSVDIGGMSSLAANMTNVNGTNTGSSAAKPSGATTTNNAAESGTSKQKTGDAICLRETGGLLRALGALLVATGLFV
ncbi:hypothetical protein B0H34DRAFT_664787, partial [Crassisporium funariophilum]